MSKRTDDGLWQGRQTRLIRSCRPSSLWALSRPQKRGLWTTWAWRSPFCLCRGCHGWWAPGKCRELKVEKGQGQLQCGDSPKKEILCLTLPPGGLSWEWFIKITKTSSEVFLLMIRISSSLRSINSLDALWRWTIQSAKSRMMNLQDK